MESTHTSVVVVGAGIFARHHVDIMLGMGDAVRIAGFVEPAPASREAMARHLAERGRAGPHPPFYDTLDGFLADAQNRADCAVVATPHNLHAPQAVACMRAGMDVLVEKPMVLDVAEARRVIRARDETGRLLSVAIPGGYSPAIRKAKELIAAGVIGEVRSVSAVLVEPWTTRTGGTWRQDAAISGGGFLFDSGSHALNTMVELAGAADARTDALHVFQDNRGTPVEVLTLLSGRFANGVYFSLSAEGGGSNYFNRITATGSAGLLHTDSWGTRLGLSKVGEWGENPVEFTPSDGVFRHFMRVRDGKAENPCPAEVGLRCAKFLDKIRETAGNTPQP
ncbi:MAG: Gfo/Idh/MocA family oxidoreductase [Kiritimatiellaeota bacterium]|nr:Gfo/Idh/MocA family oxidoreductase [Kiritimatiellota bacterium]